MSLGITKQDRKKARTTYLVLSVLLVLFAFLTVLFGVLMPKTDQIKTLGEGKEHIRGLVHGKDGTDYILTTENAMYRYDSFSNELLATFSFSQIEELLKAKGEYEKLSGGSLTQWGAKYLEIGGKDYYLVNDGNGNLFKLLDDGATLTLTDDYYLAEKKTVVKGVDSVGGELYMLMLESNNSYYVHKYGAGNLQGGLQKKKLLWDLDLSGETAGYKKLVSMSASTGILAFTATQDTLYVFKDGGGIIKLNTRLTDAVSEGRETDYFALADAYYAADYQTVYNEAYTEYFRQLLLQVEQDKYTKEQIDGASQEELETWYGEFKALTANVLKKAKDAATEKAEGAFVENNPWCGGYDKATQSLTIAEDHLDSACYSVLYSGESTVYGIVYSKKNEAVYYTNASDGYLYTADKAQIDGAACGSFLSDFSTKIDSVYYGDDKKFSNFGNGLSLNEYANTLYLKFENERTVSIVDINDKENYRAAYTFEGDFDVYSFTGDKDNKVTHVLHQVTNVAMDGSSTVQLYACTYEPESFENKALIKMLLILCAVLTAVCLGLALWFFTASKNDRALMKIKTVQRDVKRNKYVYLVLTFFVALLVMFCYYEAIGAISMSFFDYTREKPAWIWNNFGNYIRIFNQPDFWLSVGNMLFFLVFDLLLSIVPPLVFAFLLILIRNRTASNWIRSLMFIPGIIPSMATMLIWREGIYGTDGVMNQLIGLLGGDPIAFLDNVDYARWSLIFMGFPFVGGYLIFYGGMMNIPTEYHEAGRLEGLGIIKRFLLIDIPLISPQIKYIFIMTFISSVQNYARTYILGSSGTVTPVENMYRIMTGTQADYGMASAYATIIFIFLFLAVAANFKMQKKETMGEDL